jgi:hypothetical protein
VKTSDIFAQAADVIERRGWHKLDYMPQGADPEICAVCVLGAMNVVVTGNPRRGDARASCASRFGDWLRATGRLRKRGRIAEWNDQICKSADEVSAALRAAAQAERGAGR